MQGVHRPRKWSGGFDQWSAWAMLLLFGIALLFIVVDAVLIAGIVIRSGVPLSAWLKPSPTPVIQATMQISPSQGTPGTSVLVTGQGWQANEPVVIQLEDPAGGGCSSEVFATTESGVDGGFRVSFLYPTGACWSELSRALVAVRSVDREAKASSEFRVVLAVQTPTPTVAQPTATPVEPTATVEATATPTLTVEPTATSTTEPTPTATRVVWPTATPTSAIVEWRGEYFDNPALLGSAKAVRNDPAIQFAWGNAAPTVDLPADGFSVRWTRTLNYDQGLYRFRALADDGIRLFVDGELLINEWRDGSQREVWADRWLDRGKHTLRVEYYERSGLAVAQVRWEKVTSYPDWKGEYWANRELKGGPVLVRNDREVAFDWGQGSPGGGLSADDFSARWTRQVNLEGGAYRFHVLVDDGVRLWLNDRLIIDAWSDHDAAKLTTDYVLAKGTYSLKVEYYERIGNARIHAWWEKVAAPSYPDWKGEYWPNRNLSGEVVLVRNDRAIDFGWGPGSPSLGMPVDDFAVRWTRQVSFDAATYRFHAIADDGIRLWVDGQLLIDAWHDQEPREHLVDRAIARGAHSVKVEYYEHTGGARVKVWWEKVVASYPDWKGEYWSNRDLSGEPALVRNDREVDFNWGRDAPAAGLPADQFSVRWTRQVTFEPGLYRLLVWADDGVQVLMDGRVVLGEWHASRGDEVYSVDLPLTGLHQLDVRYYEQFNDARLRFWWVRIGAMPSANAPLGNVVDTAGMAAMRPAI